ncbi:GNAT family N-acetyltransferase [Actinospica durhamensis]|uniref:GNAT family N-acetyltransferase n=1 Tax=Actinospica durhamensis TaxID=1508375 RepID=A0A941EX61_9ACTN|nr:GNAT family N-acetyltransferase [Actinospica durhamensis]MBR7835579.1 GNAT family N-acetyltransferase [Actinospica durhamensis]
MAEFTISPVPDGTSDPGLDALIHAMFLEVCARYPDRVFDEQQWRSEAGDQALYLGARVEGSVMGCCAVQANPGSGRAGMELKRMYIAPGARGSGLADALLRAAEQTASSLGADELYLQTGNGQPEAMRVYERNGYTPIPAYGHYRGDAISCCYAKSLSEPAAAENVPATAEPAR